MTVYRRMCRVSFTEATRMRFILMISLKAPLHYTIRSCGACRLPCTWANRNVEHVTRMLRPDENRVKKELDPVLLSSRLYRTCCVITQSERSKQRKRPSPHSTTTEKTGYVNECTERRPCCFETFVYPVTWNSFVEPI